MASPACWRAYVIARTGAVLPRSGLNCMFYTRLCAFRRCAFRRAELRRQTGAPAVGCSIAGSWGCVGGAQLGLGGSGCTFAVGARGDCGNWCPAAGGGCSCGLGRFSAWGAGCRGRCSGCAAGSAPVLAGAPAAPGRLSTWCSDSSGCTIAAGVRGDCGHWRPAGGGGCSGGLSRFSAWGAGSRGRFSDCAASSAPAVAGASAALGRLFTFIRREPYDMTDPWYENKK